MPVSCGNGIPTATCPHLTRAEIVQCESEGTDKAAETTRLDKEIGKLEKDLAKSEKKLENPNFIDKAPPPVVAKERIRVEDMRAALRSLEEQRARIAVVQAAINMAGTYFNQTRRTQHASRFGDYLHRHVLTTRAHLWSDTPDHFDAMMAVNVRGPYFLIQAATQLMIREGVEAGEFNVPDPHVAALAIGGMVSWAYVWYRPAGRLSLAEVVAEMTRLILAMVGARAV